MNIFSEVKDFISNPRLSPYLDYCNQNKIKSLILYQMNLRLSAAFLPIISMLEVALRNAIDLRMTQNYNLMDKGPNKGVWKKSKKKRKKRRLF